MKRNLIQILSLLFVFLLFINFNNIGHGALNDYKTADPQDPAFLSSDSIWVDSVFNSLSLDEKIAQLIMIPAYSYMSENHLNSVKNMVQKYNIGGIIFMKGSPVRQALMNNAFQSVAKTPILMAMDAEWGLGMRLDSTINYPWQMTMGAIQDESQIYQMGYDIGEQLRRIGVHVNFAPVVDVNNNPLNPVINARSFGEDKFNVARKGLLYSQGLQDAGVLACFKHFPGHGDTDSDSHYSLPVIKHNFERLDSLELFPFKYGIRMGIPAVMSAHLNVLSLDSSSNLASSLSPSIISDLLKSKMGFQGLVFTDALSMKAVSKYYKPGELEVQAFKAGNDILLMPADPIKAITSIKREVKRGRISIEEVNKRCKKVLFAKSWLGLAKENLVETDSLIEDLNNPFYKVEKEKFLRNSFTLIKNSGNLLPLKNIENYKIASITLGNGKENKFSQTLGLYSDIDNYYLSSLTIKSQKNTILEKISHYNTLIISIQSTSHWPSRNYGFYPDLIDFINSIHFEGNSILTLFGNPYSLEKIDDPNKFSSILIAYEDTDEAKSLAAQSVFGAYNISGKLPVSTGKLFPVNTGIQTKALKRLSYGFPEEVNISSKKLLAIDTIINEALEIKAIPGCQVLIARKGKVIFHKAYGYHSYKRKTEVSLYDIYDLASITKIGATLPSLIKLEGEGRFSSDDLLGDHLPMDDSCNKRNLEIKNILSHQSGLPAWIPFYYKTLEPLDTSESLLSSKFSFDYPNKMAKHIYANRNIVYKDSVFNTEFNEKYSIHVAKNLYLNHKYRDTIYSDIYNCDLKEKVYRYSDLGYYLFQKIIENKTGKSLYPYVYHTFYNKMGATHLGYLPLNRFKENLIVPTENDILFRHQLLLGYVHDPGAAMLGGVAGHAGLFSNANDLAKMMQMYLNGGEYGGTRFLDSTVLNKYTQRVYSDNGNRRALGFDKPEPDEDKTGPTCKDASLNSYGHTGFTGTMVWVDPDYDLVYIFLSNRIHPNQYNLKLISENIRTRVQEVMYTSLLDYSFSMP